MLVRALHRICALARAELGRLAKVVALGERHRQKQLSAMPRDSPARTSLQTSIGDAGERVGAQSIGPGQLGEVTCLSNAGRPVLGRAI